MSDYEDAQTEQPPHPRSERLRLWMAALGRKMLRHIAKGTRLSRAQALKTFFVFVEMRHKVEIHQMTGRIVECPIDEMSRPRGQQQARRGFPPLPSRSIDCSPAGARSWRPAASSQSRRAR